VPWGAHHYSSGTAQSVLDHAQPGARLIFTCGWHITRDGKDVYTQSMKTEEKVARWFGRLTRIVDIDDQVEACRRVFASDTRWTVVRGSDLEEGKSQGLPVWSEHVGDPILESNITRRVDFALFMVSALENDELVHKAPAIVGCQTPSALAPVLALFDRVAEGVTGTGSQPTAECGQSNDGLRQRTGGTLRRTWRRGTSLPALSERSDRQRLLGAGALTPKVD
jgi:hypothetical protein